MRNYRMRGQFPPRRAPGREMVRGDQLTTAGEFGDRVTVNISVFNCPHSLLRRAVKSILGQTYTNLRLVITADGDKRAAKVCRELTRDDTRAVVRLFPKNRGQFFAHDAVARATPDPFFCVQDADDWSTPDRLEVQVRLLTKHNADMALTSLVNHRGKETTTISAQSGRLHLGLYRTESLLAVGGYFCGLRLGYDTFVILAMTRHSRVVSHERVTYHRQQRPGSMSQNGKTGHGSSARRQAWGVFAQLRRGMAGHKTAAETRKMIEGWSDFTQRDAEVEVLKGLISEMTDPELESAEPEPELELEPLRIAVVRASAKNGPGFSRHIEQLEKSLETIGRPLKVSMDDSIPNCEAVVCMGWYQGTPAQSRKADGLDPLGHWNHTLTAAKRAKELGVPMIINANWDSHPDREAWLRRAVQQLEQIWPGVCFWAVWSPAALTSPGLASVRDRLVVVPQPTFVHGRVAPVIPYERREGVCVGELGKLTHSRYVGNWSIQRCVDAIHERLPDVPVVGYDIYWAKGQIKRVRVDKVPHQSFLLWLSSFRVFASLSRFETFNRVPAEAQMLGVPVVYRPMPQSLDSRIGLTGLCAHSEEDVADAVAHLYNSQAAWETFHQAGQVRSRVFTPEVIGAHWHHLISQLRKKTSI